MRLSSLPRRPPRYLRQEEERERERERENEESQRPFHPPHTRRPMISLHMSRMDILSPHHALLAISCTGSFVSHGINSVRSRAYSSSIQPVFARKSGTSITRYDS